MKYVFGIDGGGTKTQCYVGDEKGNLLGEGFGGKCNYQICGIDTAKESVIQALSAALEDAGLTMEQLSYGVLGLSGADEDVDFEILHKMCQDVLGEIPYELCNDTWIGLRAEKSFGVASICGTGAGHAGMDKDGNRVILRNMDYELGNYGGGGEIVREALHYGFRSNEGTYKKTQIEIMLVHVFRAKNMNEVSQKIRDGQMTQEITYKIPIEVFKLASVGDEVAREILIRMGRTEGMYGAAVIKRLGMTEENVPIVFVGSLFQTGHSDLIGSYMEEIRKTAPYAYHVISSHPPVKGALTMASEFLEEVCSKVL